MAVERVSVACTATPRARRRRLFAAYYDVDAMPNVRLVNATLAALTLELNKGDLAVAVTSSDPVQTLRAVATETATTDTFVADAAEATVANQALFVAESNVLAGEADVAQANADVTNANAGYGSITFTSAESRYTRTGESGSNDSGFLFWFGLLVVVALAEGAVVLVVGVFVLAWLAKGLRAVATETATTDTFVADAAEATVANQALFVAESNVLAGEADVAQANADVTNANAGYGSITFTSAESRYTRTGESGSNDSGFLFWFGLLVVVALAEGAVVLVVGVFVLAWLAKGRKGKGKAAGTGAGGERKVAPVKSDAKPTATPSRSALTNAKAPPARSSKVVPKR